MDQTNSRGRKLLSLALSRVEETNRHLSIPKYEFTKVTTPEERDQVLLDLGYPEVVRKNKTEDAPSFDHDGNVGPDVTTARQTAASNLDYHEVPPKEDSLNLQYISSAVLTTRLGSDQVSNREINRNEDLINTSTNVASQMLCLEKNLNLELETPVSSTLHGLDIGACSYKSDLVNYPSSNSFQPNNCSDQDSDSLIEEIEHFGIQKVSGSEKKTNKKNKNYCYYCETLVNDFARHVFRNHNEEIFVQRILATKKGKQRNNLLTELRKKGNFINAAGGNIKPVKRLQCAVSPLKVKACPYCPGYYVRKQLWKHKKKCNKNNINPADQHSAGDVLFTKEKTQYIDLINKVFSRMQDNIPNETAKKDNLICAFGSKYLKTHKQKHQATTCSRKMRELAFVLLEIKKLEPSIKNLTQALKPEYFDNLVEASKAAAGFDSQTGKYRDSAFAMNICTSLRDCCEIAILDAIKKKHTLRGEVFSQIEAELKTTILLLNSNWRTEVSHEAANNLHMNKMNKVSIVPLASDLKTLRTYLVQEGTNAAGNLKNITPSIEDYKNLVEISYCRVLLLCRKRPGELQRMTTAVYVKAGETERQTYEEFTTCLTPTESVLLKNFKRVVVPGKRKEAPVLFSPDVVEHIDLLLDLRNHFVGEKNPYLFPNCGTDNSIVGYKTLSKFAKLAKCLRPQCITSRSLRKHLATICQLFQMNDGEVEQLATFMGHTSTTHRSNYRLPDDVYQTSKIAKLLMLMEKGEGANFKGKTLEQINVPLEEDFPKEDSDWSDMEAPEEIPLKDIIPENKKTSIPVVKKNKRECHKWTKEQKKIVIDFFKKEITNKNAPTKNLVSELYDKYPNVHFPIDWKKIKVFVQNVYTKNQRQ